MASYDQALAIKPDLAEAGCNKGLSLLMAGRFDPGWRLYENRKKLGGWIDYSATRSYPKPLLSGGETLAGTTVFVYWEQGLGDTIQFCRLAKLAEQRGANVVFSVQNRLRRLLQTLSPTIKLIGEKQAPSEFDYHCPLLSLPLAFGITVTDIRGEAPYLRAEPERVRKWRDKLGCKGFKIGVAWQGSRAGNVLGRSFALAEFLGASQIPNVRLISLQKNDGAEQSRNLPPGMSVETLGDDYDADDDDAFLDTAAVMENLDLIIGCDTSVTHLAGALARPVWVALKHVPDWRWMLDRTDSPWYPTMRLFRQRVRGDWRGVFAAMELELRASASFPRTAPAAEAPRIPTPRAPLSWGELIDKITILEIKVVKLPDAAARANTQKELSLLLDIAEPQIMSKAMEYKKSLKKVNESLWDVEEELRAKERASEFDEEFIGLARSVYQRNDKRALIKRQINALLVSELVEEKSYLGVYAALSADSPQG